jgi:hypothetical protein
MRPSPDCAVRNRAGALGPMILISTIRHGAIAVGITAAVAVGVYLAVLVSLFDL